MEERTKARLRVLAVLIGFGAAVGLVYMPFIAEKMTIATALEFAAQGVLIVSLVFGFEMLVAQGAVSEPLRRAPFVVAFVVKALITTALIVLADGIGGMLLFPERFAGETVLRDLARDTAFALCVAAVLQFFLLIRR